MNTKSKASVVIVVDNQKILVLKRAPGTRSFPGFWNFPGGSVDPGETIEQAAIRELEEEANIIIDSSNLSYFEVSSFPKLIVHFFMTNKFKNEVNINEESTEFKWATIEEIKRMKFIPMSPHMLDDIEYYMESLYE